MACCTYPKSGQRSKREKPPSSKSTMVTNRDWRDGYGPSLNGASSSRAWTNNYAKQGGDRMAPMPAYDDMTEDKGAF